ncbi:DUF4252 domain-containing protein [uncultured Cyclobacterium sp.]|mgnify:FL=1|uniref:DUF4252 domain-containing protein n=1 Tax=uncultured Cyclobacterium sp. TaxID=453820 RepID=UPI0030ECE596|tara:strand:- start:64461 stop:64949 length:489 start_codon:yes stop_codon:yes gene_type:complete
MKKSTIIIALTLFFSLPSALYAQSKSVDQLYQQYKGQENFFHLDLAGNFLDFAKGWNLEIEEANLDAITESIERVKFFKLPVSGTRARTDFQKLSKGLGKERYELMMDATDKDSGLAIYSKGKDSVEGLVLMIRSDNDNEFMVIELEGRFDQKTLATIGKGI